jgi:hypothetical protein
MQPGLSAPKKYSVRYVFVRNPITSFPDEPEDATPEPLNLSIPRGLKRWLQGESKRTGLPASRLVVRWMLARRNGKGVQDG